MTPTTYCRLRAKHRPFLLPPSITEGEAVVQVRNKHREINSLLRWHDSGQLDQEERQCLIDAVEVVTNELIQLLTMRMDRSAEGVVIDV